MSAILYQYAEEKAKRLGLRTDTDPDVVAYVRRRVHQYVQQRQIHQQSQADWERAGSMRLLADLVE